jgi:hypothetical protein
MTMMESQAAIHGRSTRARITGRSIAVRAQPWIVEKAFDLNGCKEFAAVVEKSRPPRRNSYVRARLGLDGSKESARVRITCAKGS